jgi:uncharacterized membrane protein YiaA
MKDEVSLWLKASKDKEARGILIKKYWTMFYSSLLALCIGIVWATIEVSVEEGSEWPLYLMAFSFFATFYAAIQVKRLKKMD